MASTARKGTMRDLDLLWAVGTAVLVINIPAALLGGNLYGLSLSVIGGGVGILHFWQLAHTVGLLCHAPSDGIPTATPKRKLHRFKLVEKEHWSVHQRTKIIECSSCGAQRKIVRAQGTGE